jgi:hypothetical protein
MKFILFTTLFLLSSCAGYNFHYQSNPFKSYGINSISVPAFLNKSLVPNISAVMTEQISGVISRETTLKLYNGNSSKSDATLVGIISSSTKRSEFFRTDTTTLIDESFSSELSGRRDFYAPSVTSYSVTLDLVLIKSPSKEDMTLINSDFKKYLDNHPRVVFTKSINLTGSFTRVIAPSDSPDDGGAVNSTKNREVFNKSVESLATSASSSFRETVLNAF